MLGSSRVLLRMSEEIAFLKRFSYISKTRKTPVAALVLILIIMCGFALIGKIETVALIANVFIFITFIVVNLSVIVLRIQDKKSERPFRIPINIRNIPVISILGILMTALLLTYNIITLIN
jgi:APA family basic amino acid/polyamine antiporter